MSFQCYSVAIDQSAIRLLFCTGDDDDDDADEDDDDDIVFFF